MGSPPSEGEIAQWKSWWSVRRVGDDHDGLRRRLQLEVGRFVRDVRERESSLEMAILALLAAPTALLLGGEWAGWAGTYSSSGALPADACSVAEYVKGTEPLGGSFRVTLDTTGHDIINMRGSYTSDPIRHNAQAGVLESGGDGTSQRPARSGSAAAAAAAAPAI